MLTHLLACLPLAAPAQDAPALELLDVYPFGDPCAATVSDDESLAFVAEGAAVTILDLLTPEPEVLRRVPVDGSILALLHVEKRLFVCGGSLGLFAVDLTDVDAGARTLDVVGDAVCTDAVRLGDTLVASFALAEGSQLRVYDLESLGLLNVVALPPGQAYALAAADESVWVALGTGGLARVDLGTELRPRALPGPGGPRAFPAPAGFELEPGLVRDVAVLGRTLYCAVDAAGLATLSIDAPWLPETPVTVTPLTVGGSPAYAVRVTARHGRLAVGLGRAPVRQLEGAPYNPNGVVGTNLNVGAVPKNLAPLGDSEALLVVDTNGGRPTKRLYELPASGWLSLELGRERVYEQHLGLGFTIRALDDAGTPVFERRPEAFPAIDGLVSETGLALFGTDFAGSSLAGIPRVGFDGKLLMLPTGIESLGLKVSARWTEDDGEWFVASGGFTWILWRLTPGGAPRFTRWDVVPPRDDDGASGHTYFHAAVDGDRLLLTRHGSSQGALLCSTSELTAAARAAEPGSEIRPPHPFRLETHDGGKRRSTWNGDFAKLADGRRIAAVAAGFDGAPKSPTYRRSRIVLFDVSKSPAAEPARLGVAHGPGEGHAVALQLARHDERTLAFVADLAQGLLVFDVTEPEAPRLVGRWAAPVSSYDGAAANVLDLELARTDTGRLAFLAAGREGLVCVDVTNPDSLELQTVARFDTPGLASGVTKARIGDLRVLLVGDQRAGLRAYAIPGTR